MVVAYVVYVVILTYFGFIVRRPNWLGWVMFTRASFVYARIFVGEREVNIWDYLPHGKVILYKSDINLLLSYLREVQGLYPLSGQVIFETNVGTLRYTVRNAWLV